MTDTDDRDSTEIVLPHGLIGTLDDATILGAFGGRFVRACGARGARLFGDVVMSFSFKRVVAPGHGFDGYRAMLALGADELAGRRNGAR